jgi:UDP-GlcNAc:undecaprenyl-phosphate/decaprenyl-phosphate GlcNAc-1-phosphate transferase
MAANILLALTSFTFCVLLAPVVCRVAISNGWYDIPGELKIHSAPTPRLGGVALMAGVLASAAFGIHDARPVGAVMLILGAVWGIGLLDDLKGTSPYLRLAVDFSCGAVLWLLGWRLQWFSNPYVDFLATLAFLTFAINSMNMLDGMDGLALTVSGIASIGFIVLYSGRPLGFASGLAWSLAAVCAAMFLYNRPPAQIFIGDSGSTLLGAALAFLALDWVRSDSPISDSPGRSIVIPLMFVGLPLADGLAAVIRRLRARKSAFSGDRRHFYDLLIRRGWGVPQILVLSGISTTILVMFSVAAMRGHEGSWLPLLGCLGLFGFIGHHLGSFEIETHAVGNSIGPVNLEQSLNEE